MKKTIRSISIALIVVSFLGIAAMIVAHVPQVGWDSEIESIQTVLQNNRMLQERMSQAYREDEFYRRVELPTQVLVLAEDHVRAATEHREQTNLFLRVLLGQRKYGHYKTWDSIIRRSERTAQRIEADYSRLDPDWRDRASLVVSRNTVRELKRLPISDLRRVSSRLERLRWGLVALFALWLVMLAAGRLRGPLWAIIILATVGLELALVGAVLEGVGYAIMAFPTLLVAAVALLDRVVNHTYYGTMDEALAEQRQWLDDHSPDEIARWMTRATIGAVALAALFVPGLAVLVLLRTAVGVGIVTLVFVWASWRLARLPLARLSRTATDSTPSRPQVV